MKGFHIPHMPHCPKLRKEHYRKALFFTVLACAVAHFAYPDVEGVVGIACNFLFFYEPVVAV